MEHLLACAFGCCVGASLLWVLCRASARDAQQQIERLAKELGATEAKHATASSEVYELQRRVTELREWRDEDQRDFDARVSEEVHSYLDYREDEDAQMRAIGWLPCASCGTWNEHTHGPVCMECQDNYRELATAQRKCGTQTTRWN